MRMVLGKRSGVPECNSTIPARSSSVESICRPYKMGGKTLGWLSARTHRQWRQPQVLVLEFEGVRAEFIGMHLKSKINRRKPFDENGNLLNDYAQEAIKARIKLATEAENIRQYIDERFKQEPAPRIFILWPLVEPSWKCFLCEAISKLLPFWLRRSTSLVDWFSWSYRTRTSSTTAGLTS